MLGTVEWGIYLYISTGTTMSMMLLFTRSSRISRTNVGCHAIIFKSPFWSVYTETQPQSFQTKTAAAFQKSRKHGSSVNDRRNRSKSYAF